MEIELSLFKQLTDAAFKTANRYFNADARAAMYSRWQDYCANGTQRVFVHGDIKSAQAMYSAAVICGFLPQFKRAVAPYIPFAFKSAEGFTGKIQPKRNVLQQLNANGIPNWEAEMRHAFDHENEPKAPAAWVVIKRIDALLKKERGQEIVHTDAELRKMFSDALKAYPIVQPESEVLSGSAQELVIAANDAKAKAEATTNVA